MPNRFPKSVDKSIRLANEIINSMGSFRAPGGVRRTREFRAWLPNFCVTHYTPFCPLRRVVGWEFPPDARTHLYGITVTDRDGMCCQVVWVKSQQRVINFRNPKRRDWLRRLKDESKRVQGRARSTPIGSRKKTGSH
jgi:hypothetical protein